MCSLTYSKSPGLLSMPTLGAAIQPAYWPGSVTGMIQVDRDPGGDLVATWGDACNTGEVTGQTYAIHAGNLSALRAGSYDHAPIGGLCDRISGALFTPGAGDEYYLVAPVGDGREGGLGVDSSGAARPQIDGVCGMPRAEICP